MAVRKMIIWLTIKLPFPLVSSNRALVQGRSGFVATNNVSLSIKSDAVAIDNKITSSNLCNSDSENGDESRNDNESLQEAYEKMYTQWLKVSATNQALSGRNHELCNLKT